MSVCGDALQMAVAAGALISFDPNLRPELLSAERARIAFAPFIAAADIFLPTEAELLQLTKAASEAEAIERIAASASRAQNRRHARRRRLQRVHRQRPMDLPGYSVDEVDPTGAGDCFDAAFITGVLQGKSASEAAKLANACGGPRRQREGSNGRRRNPAPKSSGLCKTDREYTSENYRGAKVVTAVWPRSNVHLPFLARWNPPPLSRGTEGGPGAGGWGEKHVLSGDPERDPASASALQPPFQQRLQQLPSYARQRRIIPAVVDLAGSSPGQRAVHSPRRRNAPACNARRGSSSDRDLRNCHRPGCSAKTYSRPRHSCPRSAGSSERACISVAGFTPANSSTVGPMSIHWHKPPTR